MNGEFEDLQVFSAVNLPSTHPMVNWELRTYPNVACFRFLSSAILAESIEVLADRKKCKEGNEECEAIEWKKDSWRRVDVDKNDVFVYRKATKIFGSERDSEVSADGIRRPRIEELERKTAGSVQSRGASKYKVQCNQATDPI